MKGDKICYLGRKFLVVSSSTDFSIETIHCQTKVEAIDIFRSYGTVHDVPRDGSCDYHCIMLLLQRMKLIDDTLSVTLFCSRIHEFIKSNMNQLIGVCPNGTNAVFSQYPWGQMSRSKK